MACLQPWMLCSWWLFLLSQVSPSRSSKVLQHIAAAIIYVPMGGCSKTFLNPYTPKNSLYRLLEPLPPFIYQKMFWGLHWFFVAMRGLSLVAASRDHPLIVVCRLLIAFVAEHRL